MRGKERQKRQRGGRKKKEGGEEGVRSRGSANRIKSRCATLKPERHYTKGEIITQKALPMSAL